MIQEEFQNLGPIKYVAQGFSGWGESQVLDFQDSYLLT